MGDEMRPDLGPQLPPDRRFPLLVAEVVTLAYGRTQALTNATITIKTGETVAVTGPSGSGKSTLLHVLAGLVLPNSGVVEFEGQRISTMSVSERTRLRREKFGFVFQFGHLVPELSTIDNVALPLRLRGEKAAAARAEALAMLDRLGLSALRDNRPGQLSGGEAQRVAVARALVGQPLVIFADEPTGALDSVNGRLVLDALTQTVSRANSTLVMVTHDPGVAATMARVVTMRDGRVIDG